MNASGPKYAHVRAGTNEMVVGLFGDQPLEALARIPELRWVVFRDVAEMSEPPDEIASKLDELVTELERCMPLHGLGVFDCEPRQRETSIDFLVLLTSLTRHRPNEQNTCSI